MCVTKLQRECLYREWFASLWENCDQIIGWEKFFKSGGRREEKEFGGVPLKAIQAAIGKRKERQKSMCPRVTLTVWRAWVTVLKSALFPGLTGERTMERMGSRESVRCSANWFIYIKVVPTSTTGEKNDEGRDRHKPRTNITVFVHVWAVIIYVTFLYIIQCVTVSGHATPCWKEGCRKRYIQSWSTLLLFMFVSFNIVRSLRS